MKSLIALKNKIIDNKVMKVFVFTVFIFFNYFSYASQELEQNYINKRWKISNTQVKYLNNGEILADSDVIDVKNIQTFKLKAMAKHKNKCSKVLRKLSLLEQYSHWIDFIKSSKYNEKARLFTITADHTLLPYPMIIHIIVDRPTKEGVYPFSFPTGMFRGLTGKFEIKQFDNKCLFYANSHWSGKKTKLPNFAIEIFSETLSKIGGSILMRKAN